MMNYYLKIALRNLKKQKSGSVINILGLSAGITVCLIIVLYVQYEFSFDRYNQNYHTIYRLLEVDDEGRYPDHPVVFNKIIEDNIPELQNSAILYYYNKQTDFFKVKNRDFIFKDAMFTNQNFFNIFSVKFLQGVQKNALDAPNKVVLTESTAHKLFGDQSPIGKTMNYENKYTFTVSGVIEDLPPTSHFGVDLLASIDAENQLNPNMMTKWWNSGSSFYYNLPANTNIKALERKIDAVYMKEKPKEYGESKFKLQPLSDIHLYSSDVSWDSAIRGDIQIVKAFILIAILILIIACFNYINLSFALSGKENFQIGLQKTMGANTSDILKSTLSNTILLVVACAFISVVLSMLLVPLFNQIMGTQLVFTFSNPIISIALILLILFTVLVSSLYQSLQRIRLKPVEILKSKTALSFFGKRHSFSKVSQSLTIVQLAISIILIVALITIYKQTNLLMEQKLGFNKSQLVSIENPMDKNGKKRFKVFKEELSKLPEVKNVSGSWNVPGEYINNYSDVIVVKNDKRSHFGQLPVDVDFFTTLEPKFLYGRDFNPSLGSDSNKVIINKRGMEKLELTNPIGAKVKNGFMGNKKTMEVIGVVDNIQYRSLREEGEPAIYYMNRMGLSRILVRLNPGDLKKSLNKLEASWHKLEKNIPFEYEFVDQKLQANYEKELRTRTLLSVMAFLAIGISMIGILGLTIFLIQIRTKEIGIRKVNGAKVSEVLSMLNKDFVKWVAIAFVVATPVAYYAMHKWLESFAYKTTLSWWIFALSGMLALGIALLTVSWQSWRAATRNPVEALRYE